MAANKSKKKTGAGKKNSAGGSKKNDRQKTKPIHVTRAREIGGVVCLLLAFFAAIGYFRVEGIFIDFFHKLLTGLLGWGFWITPPILLLGAYILLFHRGRPVRLRLTCALLIPLMLGAILHVFLAPGSFDLSAAQLADHWKGGLAMQSGGVLAGLLGAGLAAVFSKVGAVAVLLVLLTLMLFCAFNRTVVDVVNWSRERRAAREEAWEEYRRTHPEPEKPEPKPAPKAVKPPKEEKPPREEKKGRQVDIPVEGDKEPTAPVTTVRRRKLFEKSRVQSPDELLTGTSDPVEEDAPEFEDVPELIPMTAAPSESIPRPEPAPAPAPMPEPAPRKVKAEEAAQAAAEVSREIEDAMAQERPAYNYPPIALLHEGVGGDPAQGRSELQLNQNRLNDTLRSFGVEAHIVNVTRGPSVTRYELELEQGVKLNKITNLSDDIALALGAQAVRIAPIPEKISTVGIEVPNKQLASVPIREVISSRSFTDSESKVSFAVGKDIGGNPVVGNIAKLPHMLIAGTTGSGKSVCTNSLIISLLYKSTPDEVRLIMVDPKMVELGVYNGIPHLLIPVVTDPKKAAGALQWAVSQMMKRYQMFSEVGAKDLASYNNHARRRDDMETLPQIVVVIDELADLMLVAAKEVEESICRVAQMGRASGIHLIIATQRPSADVITGLMKANIPSRIAFAVASSLESRIILDQTGAEKLVGKGDMLYFPLGSGKPQRVQGCFITEEEVAEVVSFIKENGTARYDENVLHEIEKHVEEKDKNAKGVGGSAAGGEESDYDELLPAAIDVVLEVGQASVSMLQRRLKLGYGRAARLVDQMEEKGVVGSFEGSKPRQLLITKEQWQEMQYRQNMAGGVSQIEYCEPVPEEFPYEGDAFEQPRDMPPF